MKRFYTFLRSLLLGLAASVMLGQCLPVCAAVSNMRGVWVSTVHNLDYPGAKGLSEEELKQEARNIIDDAYNWGMNTIFLQVRPNADALYPSDIFPWSESLSGVQGLAPANNFDPLEYFITQAGEKGISLHAWINPYRITRRSYETKEEALADLSPHHPAHGMTDCVVLTDEGYLYFDPGRPEAQQLIIDGIMEIVENYDVAGIHLDDYFYTGSHFDDDETFILYGNDDESISDFRRRSVNELVAAIHSSIKTADAKKEFGISPFGIWANAGEHPSGSNTNGGSSYYQHYADSLAWIESETIDYILPQLYWEIGNESADFETLLRWWERATADSGVKLYIGLAAYRSAEAAEGGKWYGGDEITRQLNMISASDALGASMFRYGSIKDVWELSEAVTAFFSQPVPKWLYASPDSWMTDFTPEVSVFAQKGTGIEVAVTAPYGSTVTIDNGTERRALSPGIDARQRGIITTGEKSHPLVTCEKDGFLSVEIMSIKIQQVEPNAPAAISSINTYEDEDGWHVAEFTTGVQSEVIFSKKATSISLDINPCRMGVLFEDSYFTSISYEKAGEKGRYILVLPHNSRNYSYSLEQAEGVIILRIKENK